MSRATIEQHLGTLSDSKPWTHFASLRFDPLTGEFVYIRWLGGRKGIETKT
jgi:hypothetical protein